MNPTYQEKLAYLAEAYKENRVVTFFGAGASKSAKLPIAWQIVELILKKLCIHLPDLQNDTVAHFEELSRVERLSRFEVLISRLVSNCGDRAYELLDIFDYATPNDTHLVVAELFKHKYQSMHLTTNFDNLMEQALKGLARPVYEITQTLLNDSPNIVHLHGGTSGNHRDFGNIVATIDKILLPLPKPFQEILKAQLNSYTLLLVGYSAEDDDIRPIIESFTKRENIWTINPCVEDGSKIFNVVGSRDRIIEKDGDTFFNDLYTHIKKNDKQLKEISTKVIEDGAVQQSIEAAVEQTVSYLKQDGVISVILETLLDTGSYELHQAIVDSSGISSLQKFIHLCALSAQSGNKTLSKTLNQTELSEDWRTLPMPLILQLASSFGKIGNHAMALTMSEHAASQVSNEDAKTFVMSQWLYANALTMFGQQVNDKKKAISIIDRVLDKADPFPEEKAFLINTKGVALQRSCADHEDIRRYYESALASMEATRIPLQICKVLVNLAENYRTDKSTAEKTIMYLTRARDIANENSLINVLAHTSSGLLLAYTHLNKWEEVHGEICFALSFIKNYSIPPEVLSGTLIDIGVAYIGLREFAKAKCFCLDAINLIKESLDGDNFRMTMAVANYIEASVHLEQILDYDHHFIAAPGILEVAIESKYSYGAAWLAIALVKYMNMVGEIAEAKGYLDIAIEENEKNRHAELTEQIHELVASLN